jgi:hypothetical protein
MKNMELRQPLDLLTIEMGDTVSKKNLYDLIQQSKIEGAAYWAGNDVQIGNTPQQGINWLGTLPECRAAIIKTKPGSYKVALGIRRQFPSIRNSRHIQAVGKVSWWLWSPRTISAGDRVSRRWAKVHLALDG